MNLALCFPSWQSSKYVIPLGKTSGTQVAIETAKGLKDTHSVWRMQVGWAQPPSHLQPNEGVFVSFKIFRVTADKTIELVQGKFSVTGVTKWPDTRNQEARAKEHLPKVQAGLVASSSTLFASCLLISILTWNGQTHVKPFASFNSRVSTRPGKITTNLEKQGGVSKNLEKYFETWKIFILRLAFGIFMVKNHLQSGLLSSEHWPIHFQYKINGSNSVTTSRYGNQIVLSLMIVWERIY